MFASLLLRTGRLVEWRYKWRLLLVIEFAVWLSLFQTFW